MRGNVYVKEAKMKRQETIAIHQVIALERIAASLEILTKAISETGILQMRDVDRAKVYSKHLGKKLRHA